MSFIQPIEIFKTVAQGHALLGLDIGSRTIGTAICDPEWRVASPFQAIHRQKFTQTVIALEALIMEREIGGIVIGLPLQLDGKLGKAGQAAKSFGVNLSRRTGWELPICYWDERFSTRVMEREMIDKLDLSRTTRAKKIDCAAAAYILQGALDFWRMDFNKATDLDGN